MQHLLKEDFKLWAWDLVFIFFRKFIFWWIDAQLVLGDCWVAWSHTPPFGWPIRPHKLIYTFAANSQRFVTRRCPFFLLLELDTLISRSNVNFIYGSNGLLFLFWPFGRVRYSWVLRGAFFDLCSATVHTLYFDSFYNLALEYTVLRLQNFFVRTLILQLVLLNCLQPALHKSNLLGPTVAHLCGRPLDSLLFACGSRGVLRAGEGDSLF